MLMSAVQQDTTVTAMLSVSILLDLSPVNVKQVSSLMVLNVEVRQKTESVINTGLNFIQANLTLFLLFQHVINFK